MAPAEEAYHMMSPRDELLLGRRRAGEQVDTTAAGVSNISTLHFPFQFNVLRYCRPEASELLHPVVLHFSSDEK